MIVTALVLQGWFDISTQHTGNAINAYAIAYANGGRSVTDDIIPGEQITIPETLTIFKKEVQYLESKEVVPATGITSGDYETINPPLGIGSMRVGSTFIVG